MCSLLSALYCFWMFNLEDVMKPLYRGRWLVNLSVLH